MSTEELKMPALIWNQSRGLCGRVQAVDADGRVFREPGGCEDGAAKLREVGKASGAELKALWEAFDGLPENGPAFIDCQGNVDRFSRRAAVATTTRFVCAPLRGFDDPSGLPEPHRSLAQMFLTLL